MPDREPNISRGPRSVFTMDDLHRPEVEWLQGLSAESMRRNEPRMVLTLDDLNRPEREWLRRGSNPSGGISNFLRGKDTPLTLSDL